MMKHKMMLIILMGVISFLLAQEDVIDDRIIFNIKGMTCQECVQKVEKALESVDGILEAQASLEKGIAIIIYAKDKVKTETIGKAVQKAGFEYKGSVEPGRNKTGCAGS